MENVTPEASAQPEPEAQTNAPENTDTTPVSGQEEILIPVKFNKEIKNISLEKAGELAQKGMKFETISQDFENLKALAKEEGKSVPEYINELKNRKCAEREQALAEKCGGDTELARHIIELEKSGKANDDMGFSELCEQFPEIKSISDLPEAVTENAQIKGTRLLDEFLRYKLLCHKKARDAQLVQDAAHKTSIGPQIDRTGGENPETAEFLKGLWK